MKWPSPPVLTGAVKACWEFQLGMLTNTNSQLVALIAEFRICTYGKEFEAGHFPGLDYIFIISLNSKSKESGCLI